MALTLISEKSGTQAGPGPSYFWPKYNVYMDPSGMYISRSLSFASGSNFGSSGTRFTSNWYKRGSYEILYKDPAAFTLTTKICDLSSVSWGAVYTFGGGSVSDADTTTIFRCAAGYYSGSYTSAAPESKITPYKLTFNLNGGTAVSGGALYNANYTNSNYLIVFKGSQLFNGVAGPTRTGYVFNGWYTNDGTQVYSANGNAIKGTSYWNSNLQWSYSGNVTLYAQWVGVASTVTFNANGGTTPTASKTVNYSSTYGTLPTPTRDGYRFLGWYTATSGGSQVTSSTTVSTTSSHTLYARWVQVLYLDLNFYLTDGTKVQDASIAKADVYINGSLAASGVGDYYVQHDINSTYEVKNFVAGPGYVFSSVSGASGTLDASKYVTVYLRKVIAKFNARGGTLDEASRSMDYGSILELPTPVREDSNFNRWYAIFDGTNFLNLGRSYMYTDKISVHLEAYQDDWSNFKSQELISCTEGGGWNLGEEGSGKLHFSVYDSNYGYRSFEPSRYWADLSPGWHTFDMVFDGSKAYGYLDSELIGESESFTSNAIGYNTSNSIFLGAEAGGSLTTPDGSYFTGRIANVIIKNTDTRITDPQNGFVTTIQDMTLYAEWDSDKGIYIYRDGRVEARGFISGSDRLEITKDSRVYYRTHIIGEKFSITKDGDIVAKELIIY